MWFGQSILSCDDVAMMVNCRGFSYIIPLKSTYADELHFTYYVHRDLDTPTSLFIKLKPTMQYVYSL